MILLLQILSIALPAVVALFLTIHLVTIPFQHRFHYPLGNVFLKVIGIAVLSSLAIWLLFAYGWIK